MPPKRAQRESGAGAGARGAPGMDIDGGGGGPREAPRSLCARLGGIFFFYRFFTPRESTSLGASS